MTQSRQHGQLPDGAFVTRLTILESDFVELKHEVARGFTSLHAKFDERSKIQWPGLAVLLSVITTVGALAFWPIQTRQTEIKEDFLRVARENLDRDRRMWDQILQVRVELATLKGRGDGRD